MATKITANKEVADNMKQLAEMYIEDAYKNSLVFRGTMFDSATQQASLFTDNNSASTIQGFVVSVLNGYEKFKTSYSNDINITANTQPTNFKWRNMNAADAYTEKPLVSTSTTISAYNLGIPSSNVEISVADYVKPGESINLRNNLNRVRNLYSLLEDNNYKNYMYLINNPGATAANFPISIVDFDGTVTRVNDTPAKMEDMKALIRGLGTTSLSSTNSFLVAGSSTGMTVSSVSDSNTLMTIPEKVKGDAVVLIRPTSATQVAYIDMNVVTNMSGTNTTQYVTYSFYVKTRNQQATPPVDVPTSSINIDMMLTDVAGANAVARAVKYTERRTFPVTSKWQRVSITRAINIPTSALFNATVRVSIETNYSTGGNATRHNILVTGAQGDVQSTDPAGTLPAFRQPLFDDMQTSRVVIRRVLLLYELLASYYISLYILEQNTAAGGNITRLSKAGSLVNIMYEYITSFNDRLIRGNDNLISKLNKTTSKRMRDYSVNTADLTAKTVQLQDGQYDLKSRIGTLESEKTNASSTSRTALIAGIVFAIVAVICVAIYVTPMEPHQKRNTAIMVSSIGVVIFVIMYFMYKPKIEKFQSARNLLSTSDNYLGGVSAASTASYFQDAEINALIFATDYLDYTVTLGMMLQTSFRFGNVNQALMRERQYYAGVNNQITMASHRVDEVSNVHSLKKYTNRARMSFFISLGILVAVTIAALVLAPPMFHTLILIIAGIVLFITILIYLLDTAGRVRTSSSKVYWGPPNVANL